jgi:DNA ligase (NAD+)
LAGSTISRATLHNQEEIARKDIRIGDTVVIEKGGDVIPKVVEVDLKKRPSFSRPWKSPKLCPICKTAVVQIEGEVAIRCPNRVCQGSHLRQIIHFASKQAMDIEHMGEKVVEKLFELGLVRSISDIYLLTDEDLGHLEGFKEKSIANLLNSIEMSKDCTLPKLLMGLGIPFVGKETAEELATVAGEVEKLFEMDEEDFCQIEGIGDKTAHAIFEFFQNKANEEQIYKLLEKKRPVAGFSGKSFVLTGSLENFTRDEASRMIKERGGKVSSSVSKKTDFVLVGDDPGSKYDKAKKLGVQILSEKEFQKMCDQ